MAQVNCGVWIALERPGDEVCTAGCLVRYKDQPNKIMLLSVCHGLVKSNGKKGDVVVLGDGSGKRIGLLENWTTFHSQIQADAALVWVDPAIIGLALGSLGAPAGVVGNPLLDSDFSICTQGNVIRHGTVDSYQDVQSSPQGPGGWTDIDVLYQQQVICTDQCTVPGDSGAVAIDGNNNVIGMVVAVTDDGNPRTVITPISSILQHPDFGRNLEVVLKLPSSPLKPKL